MPRPPIEIETGDQPESAIIILHGLGADGTDFVPVAQELDLAVVGPVRFVFPYAPVIPVTINGGYRMPAWYDILGADLVRREDEGGLRASLRLVGELIDTQIERGIAPERIVIAGFSQGCAMALLAGVRHPARLAGIAGLSGYLPLADTTARERHPASAATPIFLAAGEHDGIVAPARSQAARQTLEQLGYVVDWHTYPMAHSVCAEELRDLNDWLLRVLAR
ncbi:MAG: dienelactone hydrolase family protein [Comamonas sp.]